MKPKSHRTRDSINEAQRAVLCNATLQRTIRAEIVKRHRKGNGKLDPGTLRDFGIREVPVEVGDGPLLVVEDDILVRAGDDADRAPQILRDLNLTFTGPHRIDCGCDRELPVVWFEIANPTDSDMTRAVDALIDAGIEASFNHIHPDAGIKGGNGTAALVPQGLALPTFDPARKDIGKNIVVAIIDTGIAAETRDRTDHWLDDVKAGHADIDTLKDFGDPDLLDSGAGHGTFVAGVVRQLAPGAVLRAYRALDTQGIGSEQGIACAILRAVQDGANIINLSLGQESYRDRQPVALKAALELVPPDVVVIAAAGNLGDDHPSPDPVATRPHWPAAFDRVIAVAGLDGTYAGATWSKRGTWVDASTTGEGILSPYVAGEEEHTNDNPTPDTFLGPDPWAIWLGTSFAAPQIAGLVAAAASPGPGKPSITVQQALVAVLATSTATLPNYGKVIASKLS